MHQLVIKPRAINMQSDAYQRYEEKQKGLGELFLEELDECIGKLQTQPMVYSYAEPGYRYLILRKVPFVIVYKIIKTTVVVYAVFHTNRNPKEKFKRK